MTDDPVMRYVDVLKQKALYLERENVRLTDLVIDQDKVIKAYVKMTSMTIKCNKGNDDDNERPITKYD
jgi:hypothetical protein